MFCFHCVCVVFIAFVCESGSVPKSTFLEFMERGEDCVQRSYQWQLGQLDVPASIYWAILMSRPQKGGRVRRQTCLSVPFPFLP